MKLTEEIIQRFWSKVKKTNGCWEWIAGYNSNQRPIFAINRKSYYAHRVSWIISVGEILNNLLVCHKCDNPKCVRADHLFLGTQRDNNIDCIQKGRRNDREYKKKYIKHPSRAAYSKRGCRCADCCKLELDHSKKMRLQNPEAYKARTKRNNDAYTARQRELRQQKILITQ